MGVVKEGAGREERNPPSTSSQKGRNTMSSARPLFVCASHHRAPVLARVEGLGLPRPFSGPSYRAFNGQWGHCCHSAEYRSSLEHADIWVLRISWISRWSAIFSGYCGKSSHSPHPSDMPTAAVLLSLSGWVTLYFSPDVMVALLECERKLHPAMGVEP